MAMSFRDMAQRATSLSDIMEGRDKMTCKQLVEKYPDGVTIADFDIVRNKKNEEYVIFTIEEDDTIFVNGSTVLNRIFFDAVDAYDGEVSVARREFKREGGLAVRLYMDKTKGGDDLIKVDVK